MKKIFLTLGIAVLCTMTMTASVFAEEKAIVFSDVARDSELGKNVYKLVEAGCLNGYVDGTFKPDNKLRRDELVKMVNSVFRFETKADTAFTDIPSDFWAYDQILIGKKAGYIDGTPDGTFQPDKNITREQICKILRAINNLPLLPYGEVVSDTISPWAKNDVMIALSCGLFQLEKDNKFRATEPITRGELCMVLAGFIVPAPPVVVPPVDPTQPPGGGGPSGGGDEEITKEELNESIKNALVVLNGDIRAAFNPNTQEIQIQIIDSMIVNLGKYQADSSYDYKPEAKKTFELYKKLTELERDELQNSMTRFISLTDINNLYGFFYDESLLE